jgi:hypothetical protein
MVHVIYELLHSRPDELSHMGVATGKKDITSFKAHRDVIEIEEHAAAHCTGIESVSESVKDSCEGFTMGKNAFEGVTEGCTALTSLVGCPPTIATIGEDIFRGCSGIMSLEGLPPSLTKIGDLAFKCCTGITSLERTSCNTSTLTSEGYGAGSDCPGITSIAHGSNPDCYIHPNAFNRCPQQEAAASANGHAAVELYG